MSVKIMGAVWDSDLPQEEKFVALAYADHANHDGSDVYPSNSLIAWKTMYSVRQIQRIRNKLTARGVLIPVMNNVGGRNVSNRYFFNVNALPKRDDWSAVNAKNHDILSSFSSENNDTVMSHFSEQNHDISEQNHDIAESKNYDIAESYDPSLTVNRIVNARAQKNKNNGKSDCQELTTTVEELLEDKAEELWQEQDIPGEVTDKKMSVEEYKNDIKTALENGLRKHGSKSLDETLIDLYLLSVPVHLYELARSFCECVERPPNKREDSNWRKEWQVQYELGLTGENIKSTYMEMMYAGLSVKSPASVTGMADSSRRRAKIMREKEVADKCIKRISSSEAGKSLCGEWYTRQQIEQMDEQEWLGILEKHSTYDMNKHLTGDNGKG